MTDNNHPITPPPELVALLRSEAPQGIRDAGVTRELHLITAAYRAGADQELEACVEWASCFNYDDYRYDEVLRDIRRSPEPPSLKEQALQALYRFDDTEGHEGLTPEQIAEDFVLIRRALESLPD